MPGRFINCTACRGCHTGRGGRYCTFVSPTPSQQTAGVAMMFDEEAPDLDTPEYVSYLSRKIEEEEDRLKSLQDKCRVTALEEELARLRFKTADLTSRSPGHAVKSVPGTSSSETGVASQLLAAASQGTPRGLLSQQSVSALGGAESTPFIQRSKDEKLRALSHLAEPKQIEKITYREFICAMTCVLKLLVELDIAPKMYVAHMCFIASKAKLNIYATDALIRYESSLTEKVINGQCPDWLAADPECVALHLGADATYAVRQGGSRWSRQSPGAFGGNCDFSDWPKEVCWLFNNTSCYFPRCKKAHICGKCKRTGHTMKECKSQDDSAQPSSQEVLSNKPAKEARKA